MAKRSSSIPARHRPHSTSPESERSSRIGDKAVDGLRGIRYVLRRLEEQSKREKSIRTSSFNLPANQVRYGRKLPGKIHQLLNCLLRLTV